MCNRGGKATSIIRNRDLSKNYLKKEKETSHTSLSNQIGYGPNTRQAYRRNLTKSRGNCDSFALGRS